MSTQSSLFSARCVCAKSSAPATSLLRMSSIRCCCYEHITTSIVQKWQHQRLMPIVKLNNLTYHCCSLCTIHDLADAKQIQTVHQKNQLSGNIECCIFTEVNIFCGTSDPPNGYVCNEIAYISVIKRWRPTIQNVRSYRDADIGSLSGESKTEASN